MMRRFVLTLCAVSALTLFANAQVAIERGGIFAMLNAGSAPPTVTVNGATTFAVTTSYLTLACTGAEAIDTITGGVTGMLVYIAHTDTDCTINDDETATATDAVDLTGAANDVGAPKKVLVLIYNGSSWEEVSESDN